MRHHYHPHHRNHRSHHYYHHPVTRCTDHPPFTLARGGHTDEVAQGGQLEKVGGLGRLAEGKDGPDQQAGNEHPIRYLERKRALPRNDFF